MIYNPLSGGGNKPMEDELLTKRQAAERLGMTVSGVQRLIQKGKVRATLYGNNWMISAKSVDEYSRTRRMGRPPKTS